MFNIKHILEGIVNTVQAKEAVQKIANERRAICNECKYNSENRSKKYIRPDAHCTICKCNLAFKTHSLHSSCPIDKWLAVATEEENEALKNKINPDEQQSI